MPETAETIVLYTLKVGGDMEAKAPVAAEKLRQLGDAARKAKQDVAGAAAAGSGFGARFAAAAKQLQQSQMVSQMETMAALGIQVGGSVSQVSAVITSLIRPVATITALLGPASIAMIGLTAAMAAAIPMALKLGGVVDGAIEARDRLTEQAIDSGKALSDLGYAAEIPTSAIESLEDYERAGKQLATTMDLLSVSVGAKLAPNLTRLTTTLDVLVTFAPRVREEFAGVSDRFARWAEIIDALNEKTEKLRSLLVVLATGGGVLIVEKLKAFVTGQVDQEIASDRAAASVLDAAAAYEALGMAVTDEIAEEEHRARLVRESEEREKSRAKALRDTTAALKEQAREQRELVAEMARVVSSGQFSGIGARHRSTRMDLGAAVAGMGVTVRDGVQPGQITGDDPVPVKVNEFSPSAADRLGQALGALRGGLGGLAGAAGPWGAVITAVVELLPDIDETIADLHDQAMAWPGEVQDAIDNLLGDLPGIITDGVTHLAEDSALIPNLIASLIAAAPQILAAVIEAALMGPQVIIEALFEAFERLWESIKNLPRELGQSLGNVGGRVGDLLGIHTQRAKGEREFFGIKYDRFAMHGGVVTETGLAMVHRGERIGPQGRGAGPVSIGAINVHGVQSPERFVEQLQSLLGARGLNLTLEPHGG